MEDIVADMPAPPVHDPGLHPQWCDPASCIVEPNFGHGLMHLLHRRVLLREPSLEPSATVVSDVLVEVSRSDVRRLRDGAVVDVWDKPAALDPPKVYVAGLDQVDLSAEQAQRIGAALAAAAAMASGASTTD